VVGEPKQQQEREILNLGRPLDLESASVNDCLQSSGGGIGAELLRAASEEWRSGPAHHYSLP
jgi:hypothetical protein